LSYDYYPTELLADAIERLIEDQHIEVPTAADCIGECRADMGLPPLSEEERQAATLPTPVVRALRSRGHYPILLNAQYSRNHPPKNLASARARLAGGPSRPAVAIKFVTEADDIFFEASLDQRHMDKAKALGNSQKKIAELVDAGLLTPVTGRTMLTNANGDEGSGGKTADTPQVAALRHYSNGAALPAPSAAE
jgi:hypothetical protein